MTVLIDNAGDKKYHYENLLWVGRISVQKFKIYYQLLFYIPDICHGRHGHVSVFARCKFLKI